MLKVPKHYIIINIIIYEYFNIFKIRIMFNGNKKTWKFK